MKWNNYHNWEEAEKAWDEGAEKAAKTHPLRVLKTLPQMPGISACAAKGLKWKSLKWMVAKDEKWAVTRYILKKPFTHAYRYCKSLIRSIFKKYSYIRDGDFFLYGVESVAAFQELLHDPKSLLVIGFSYCEKPHECPSGRFTSECIRDPDHPVCRQCFIGKAIHAAIPAGLMTPGSVAPFGARSPGANLCHPIWGSGIFDSAGIAAIHATPERRVVPLIIPTIHYIGEKIFEIVEANPDKRVLFLITACELTLEMFGDFGNMAGIKGIGVRLDGRICNTMKAFELSEKGIKPGLTVVVKETEKRILDLLREFTLYPNKL